MWTLCAASVSVSPYEPYLVDLEEHVALKSSISSDSYNFVSLSSMDASTPKARTQWRPPNQTFPLHNVWLWVFVPTPNCCWRKLH